MTDELSIKPSTLIERATAELTRIASKPLDPGLHIVATPIGNLGDITLRALSALANADAVYCEDTRHSRTLMVNFGIAAKLLPYHEHNAERERPRILRRLEAGERVALISDAGTPLISDPGYKLARDVIAAGHQVHSLPGPCAAIAALSVAGLPTDSFLFAGFLPAKHGQRLTRLTAIKTVPATLVFYEAPTRLGEALADMAAILGDRPCCIVRELTKLHEETTHGTLVALAGAAGDASVRGEITIVVGPPTASTATDSEILDELRIALETATARDAVRDVADRLGASRTRVYDLAMTLKQGGE